MISSILIENWRTHKKSELEFNKGTNVIVGVMGAGKSSIVNALSYGLFGTFPSLKSRQVSLEEVIMSKPNKEENAKIKICLKYNSNEYIIERTILTKGTNTAKLYENGKFISGPKQTEVTKRIEKILGINYDLFSRAIYSEQNETDFFLKLSPRERKQKFDELLDLEKYELARKNSTSLQNQLKKRNIDEEDFLNNQKNNLNNQNQEHITQSIKIEKLEIEKLKKEYFEIQKETFELEKKTKILQEKEKENKIYEDLLIKTESKIESLNEDIQKNKNISIETINPQLDKLKKDIKQKKEFLEKKEKENFDNEKNKNLLKEELKVCIYQKSEFEKEIKNMHGLGNKCSVCKQELNETHKKNIISENELKIQDSEKKINELEIKIKNFNEIIEENNKQTKELKLEIDEITKTIYNFENEIKKLDEINEKIKQLEKLMNEPEKLKQEIKKIGFNKEEIDKTKNEYYSKKSKLDSINTKIQTKQELIKNFEKTLKTILEIQKGIEILEKRITISKKAVDKLNIFGHCLKATQTELREQMISTLNQAMSAIWENVYPYKDYIDAKLAITQDGYDLMVKNRNKEWVRVEGILSGGERSAAAICIRISFALILTKNLSMLILDEPTHNLDSNSIQKLSDMLREKLPGLVDQVFIITHDKELEKAASANLYILKRNKDLDEATRIENSN
jgi:DNA repair protein SbcC/Rad50